MKSWYYAQFGNRLGPFDRQTIEDLYRSGGLKPEELVWEEGMPDWVRADSVFKQQAPAPADASATPPPALPTTGLPLPDYGDFLCWGIVLAWLGNCGWLGLFAIMVLHLIELTSARKQVTEGRIQPNDYTNNHPVFIGLGLCCCIPILHPLMMYWRNKSKLFKPQPHAVWFSIVTMLLCWGTLFGIGLLPAFIDAMEKGQ